MSDGGAAVIGKGVEGVIALARFPAGRGVLWVGAAWLTLCAVTGQAGARALWFFIAVAIALVALVAGFLADRRKRAERATLKTALALLAFTLFSLVGAVWLVFRTKKTSDDLPPPTAEELEQLVTG